MADCEPSLLTRMFLCGTPVREFSWEKLLRDCNEDNRRKTLEDTVLHPLCQRYPLDLEYQKYFCKMLIQAFEENGETPCEELYNHFVTLLPGKTTPYCFKIYYSPKISDFVPIAGSRNLLSNGTTGLATWQGAMVLGEWCLSNTDTLERKSILELGCGAGFTGIVLLKSCVPKRYVFTDYHCQVLSLLKYNVSLNLSKNTETTLAYFDPESFVFHEKDFSNLSVNYSNEIEVLIRSLDWTSQSSRNRVISETAPFDIILAADVVFDPSLIPGLVQTLYQALSHRTKHLPSSFACFSLTVRNPVTYQLFLDELDNNCLEYTELGQDFEQIFHFDRSADIRLLKIQLR